ncbi:MAG: M81 family metallopeptidase [Pseudomonadota bacterium]
MKVFIACLGTETNTFAPIPTGYRSFEETMLYHGDATAHPPNLFSQSLHVWRRRAEARGWEVAESLSAFAQPAGTTGRTVYEGFRDEIVADLKAAMPVDIVLIQMHGAMIAEGYDDCEGDLMTHLRAAAPEAVLGLELDLHFHLTDELMEACTLIVGFKEYPHTDVADRAEELFTLAADTAEGKIQPVMRDFDCRMVAMYMTPIEPMRSFVDDMMAAEGKDGVLSLTLAHGFPWGDMPRVGTRMLAIADGSAEVAAEAAEAWGKRLIAEREEICPPRPDIQTALDRAAGHNSGTVVLADMADNAGGGAPSDSTFFLRAILDRGMTGVASGIYWDPSVTRIAAEAGEGARLPVRLGGKLGPMSGEPVDLEVTVKAVRSGLVQHLGDGTMPLGEIVWLEADGIDLVVNDTRTQCFHPEVFEQLGIRLAERRLVIVKSTNHFYAGFAPIAVEVIHVATPGAISPDFGAIPFQNRDLNYWPRVADPWS